MPYQDKVTGEIKYTQKERQDFHNRQAKPGSLKTDKKTGQTVFVSDFERGAHKAQADAIARNRYRYKQSQEAKAKQGK